MRAIAEWVTTTHAIRLANVGFGHVKVDLITYHCQTGHGLLWSVNGISET